MIGNAPMANAKTRRCSRCGSEKPLSMFHKNKAEPLGHSYTCKPCASEYQKQWQAKNPGRHAHYARTGQSGQFVPRVLRHTKSRAKIAGVPFNLVAADITPLPEQCPILGIPLDYTNTGVRNKDSAASLDRINPRYGYIAGNVQVISLRANRIKNDATPEELRRIADYMAVFG